MNIMDKDRRTNNIKEGMEEGTGGFIESKAAVDWETEGSGAY